MPQIRKDYILDRYVIIAAERGKRPHELVDAKQSDPAKCFFCPGKEETTPPEISRTEKNGRWQIRVFPNKFPAVANEGNKEIFTANIFYTYGDAVGCHEVIVETPDHDKQLWDLSGMEIGEVISAYKKRHAELIKNNRYVSVFKNNGKEAGCSIAHSHSQIIAYNMIPEIIRRKQRAVARFQSCPYCDVIRRESGSERAIFEDEDVLLFTPYASRFPYEAWILPKKHIEKFEDIPEISFAKALTIVLLGLKKLGAPYNYYFHYGDDLHLQLIVCPRLTTAKWAGFEQSTGTIINPVSPEIAAAHYREDK